MPNSTTFFSKLLILWYIDHKRELPWRLTKDPYAIWLSEIILQQTKVAQGLPYYKVFVSTFPTVHDLANAPEEKVLKLWQGLGYYSRARNLHFTSKYISKDLKGTFPTSFKELIKLKGVGDYTASAIASICYHEATAVVDGNVYRVLARFFGISTPINSTQGIKEFKSLAQQLIDPSQPGTYNQAIMEFGARHCTPKKPDCTSCIFNDKCVALQKNTVTVLPVKLKKTVVKKWYFNYFIIQSDGDTIILQQRTKRGIWQQLYEFPLIETDKEIRLDQLQQLEEYKELSKTHSFSSISLYNEKSIIHKLSHRHLHTRFWLVETNNNSVMEIPLASITKYPVPTLIENFITSYFDVKV